MKSITFLLAAFALVAAGLSFSGCADRDIPRDTPPETNPPGGGAVPTTPPPAPVK